MKSICSGLTVTQVFHVLNSCRQIHHDCYAIKIIQLNNLIPTVDVKLIKLHGLTFFISHI